MACLIRILSDLHVAVSYTSTEPVLLLNGQVIANNSILDPDEIETGERCLLCITNLTECCRRIDRNNQSEALGEWYYADGRDIPILADLPTSPDGTLYNIRGMSTVRLERRGSGPRPLQEAEGMFRCAVPNAENVMLEFFVGIYLPEGTLSKFTGGGGRGG